MTGDEFWRLHEDDNVIVPTEDAAIYRVLDFDDLGRIKMQKVVYFINLIDYDDEEYDSYYEAADAKSSYMGEDEDSDLE